jgi:hypothetical protein
MCHLRLLTGLIFLILLAEHATSYSGDKGSVIVGLPQLFPFLPNCRERFWASGDFFFPETTFFEMNFFTGVSYSVY